VQPSPTAVEMIKLMGASPTPLAYGELYTALQQKVVDGAENNETALTLARHGEVAKYFSEDEHTMIPDVLLISLKSWNKLTPEQQKILKQAADNSMLYHKEIWTKMIAEERAKAQKQLNVQFVPVDKAPFVQAVKTMHDTAKQNPALKPYIERIETLK
ncbi:TRAP transporter substrate-binding protein DctP, partial [Avibacterium paragallinarum]